MTPNGEGGAIGKDEKGNIVVRHPKTTKKYHNEITFDLIKFDPEKCIEVKCKSGVNGWLCSYKPTDITEL